jgi:molecular chaperone IbpA
VPFIFRLPGRTREPDSSLQKGLEIEIAATQISLAAACKGSLDVWKRRSGLSPASKRKTMLLKGEQTMRHVDFSPFYRSTVGFDRLFSMLDQLATPEGAQTYPPYNIERTGDDAYRISMAVAGFSDKEISLEAHRNVLTIKGEKAEEENEDSAEFLYRGIASRAFERRFQLADHVG